MFARIQQKKQTKAQQILTLKSSEMLEPDLPPAELEKAFTTLTLSVPMSDIQDMVKNFNQAYVEYIGHHRISIEQPMSSIFAIARVTVSFQIEKNKNVL